MVICLNYMNFEKKLRSVIVSENHYLNKIFDVHPLRVFWSDPILVQQICLPRIVDIPWYNFN